ncbi:MULTISPECIES: TrmH family RNA methyltransferase [Cellulophaga]|uniref:tRNA (guanosine(18)-2'-O)-methyltransferase n=1 Tax=Cellulophaga lytica (strain ATCC 23178 / DSM 7489 / JCM 8516 / NBRC 14961 / NCIMB 1423 / VKM B-1433 / Cy l20) TaxID=867900 RepID=F0RG16_CELLC|nr:MULTISPECIES: RNA methyltransferase [Cellulophaga]ADY27976.1 tRNA/rRNA methyltransferase (SpoU) [Cellulophaga lytica DSM 7489]AIM59056.1 rRNA methyltransferase [Cellulophaga lytica]TVZ09455.1 tRNA (guanosine-2'-O-)-methyltransferase [Cellulophaga sp. RHA_52]WQG77833.1 RNA methyltransferase [Cellulophaga lytica]
MTDTKLLTYLENIISEERKTRFLDILKDRTNYITVAIEDVFQMHNTSAVIRSCDAFGVQTAHLIESKYSEPLDKNIAMGAQQWVTTPRYNTTTECIDTLRKDGYKIIATSPHTDSYLLDDFKIDDKIALFFGTEKSGLSQEVLDKADGYVKIPMVGFSESLNISVSAAILLQHLTTELKKTTKNWQLTAEEILAIRLDWTKKSIKSIDDILERYYKENT